MSLAIGTQARAEIIVEEKHLASEFILDAKDDFHAVSATAQMIALPPRAPL